MSLPAGTRLGPYEISGLLGTGGMGEVYKARDTRLDRTVAIKILPPDVSGNTDPSTGSGSDRARSRAERRARFEREAKTVAGLSHPNICPLFDVGDHEGAMFLVMEHLAGETLADRLHKGPLPLEQALTVATEIADALSAAHRQGVIHRDLKPANVMLTKAGAKLLDFGLAKLTGHGEQPAAVQMVSALPTQAPLTGQGVIVGTLQYMAPEQLEGKPPDARTDLWALGAILYEMVTGKRAFEGTSVVSLMSAIMDREPQPIATLQPLTPPMLERLVRLCLAKSAEDRPDTAHDVANDLRSMRETSGVGVLAGVQPKRRHRLWIGLLVAGGLSLFATGLGVMWFLRPAAPLASLVRVSLDVHPAEEVNAGGSSSTVPTPGGSRTAMTWTHDGRALVFVGRRSGVQQLYVRRLDAAEARPLPNTEGAQVPAVSADGQWVAFWANGAIRKVPLGGGPAMDLASPVGAPPWGLVWDADGRVFFGRDDNRIWMIPVEGAPTPVTTVGDSEVRHALPSLVPGGRVLLYTARKRGWSWGDEEVVAQTLATGTRKVLLKDAADARYVPPGRLVFLRRGALFAVPFDPDRLQVLGKEVPVLDAVAQALTSTTGYDVTGAGQFAIAPDGTLAWMPGSVVQYPDATLVTVGRRGEVSPLPAPVRSYAAGVRLSPDGRRLAVTMFSLADRGLWVYDMSRGTVTPLSLGGEAHAPRWSPDGQRLVFWWLMGGRRALVSQAADLTAPARVLVAGGLVPSSFTPDGRQLAAVAAPAWNIVIVTMENGQARVQPLTEARHQENCPEFSPDGRWLAYGSDASGRSEVYLQSYPVSGAREPISVEGGQNPAWNPNGRELFFLGLPDAADKAQMMAVEFAPGSPPRIGRPRVLFEFDNRRLNLRGFPQRNYDVAPDGQRFYTVHTQTPTPAPVVTRINLILNWVEELNAKVPPAR